MSYWEKFMEPRLVPGTEGKLFSIHGSTLSIEADPEFETAKYFFDTQFEMSIKLLSRKNFSKTSITDRYFIDVNRQLHENIPSSDIFNCVELLLKSEASLIEKYGMLRYRDTLTRCFRNASNCMSDHIAEQVLLLFKIHDQRISDLFGHEPFDVYAEYLACLADAQELRRGQEGNGPSAGEWVRKLERSGSMSYGFFRACLLGFLASGDARAGEEILEIVDRVVAALQSTRHPFERQAHIVSLLWLELEDLASRKSDIVLPDPNLLNTGGDREMIGRALLNHSLSRLLDRGFSSRNPASAEAKFAKPNIDPSRRSLRVLIRNKTSNSLYMSAPEYASSLEFITEKFESAATKGWDFFGMSRDANRLINLVLETPHLSINESCIKAGIQLVFEALRWAPENWQSWDQVHRLLILNKSHSAAEFTAWEAARRFPFHPKQWIRLGEHYANVGKFDLAEAAYDTGRGILPSAFVMSWNLAKIIGRDPDRLEKAEGLLEDSIHLDPTGHKIKGYRRRLREISKTSRPNNNGSPVPLNRLSEITDDVALEGSWEKFLITAGSLKRADFLFSLNDEELNRVAVEEIVEVVGEDMQPFAIYCISKNLDHLGPYFKYMPNTFETELAYLLKSDEVSTIEHVKKLAKNDRDIFVADFVHDVFVGNEPRVVGITSRIRDANRFQGMDLLVEEAQRISDADANDIDVRVEPGFALHLKSIISATIEAGFSPHY